MAAERFIMTWFQLLCRRGLDHSSFMLLHQHVLAVVQQPEAPRPGVWQVARKMRQVYTQCVQSQECINRWQ